MVEFRSKLPAGTDVDDHTCLRFLRSRKFDVEKAADLYSKDIVRFALGPSCIAFFFAPAHRKFVLSGKHLPVD